MRKDGEAGRDNRGRERERERGIRWRWRERENAVRHSTETALFP